MKRSIAFLMSAFMLLAGCDGIFNSGDGDFKEGDALLRSDKLPKAAREEVSRVEVTSDREDFVAFDIRIRETRNFEDLSNFGQNDTVLYPGALIRGNGAAAGTLVPAILPDGVTRNPVDLSLGGLSGSSASVAFQVISPMLSDTRVAINSKLAEMVGASSAAQVEYSKEEVNSSEQLALSLGIGVSWPTGAKVSGSVNLTSTEEKSRVVVRFKQIYYTVDMNTLASPAALFKGASESTINSFIASDNPMYVSRVSYGRQVFFILESTCSTDELKAAAEAAFEKGVKGTDTAMKVDVNATLSTKTVLANTTIKAIVYGGDSSDAVDIKDYDSLLAFMKNGASFDAATGSNALPLSYQMRFLSDNTIGALSSNADYTMRQYVRTKQRVQVKFSRIVCTGADDGQNSPDFWNSDRTLEVKGEAKVRAMKTGMPETTAYQFLADFWGNILSINNGEEKVPPTAATQQLLFTDLSASDSYIEVYLSFKEDDAAGDDDLGSVTEKIYLANNWNIEHKYSFSESGASIDAYVDIMVLP